MGSKAQYILWESPFFYLLQEFETKIIEIFENSHYEKSAISDKICFA